MRSSRSRQTTRSSAGSQRKKKPSQIKAHNSGASNEQLLREQVMNQLALVEGFTPRSVHIKVSAPRVVLWGEVRDQEQREAFEAACDSVDGVEEVENKLIIQENSPTDPRDRSASGGF